jgi:hypothetical protein
VVATHASVRARRVAPTRQNPAATPVRLGDASRGCSSMVEPQSSKLITRVRFPSSPPRIIGFASPARAACTSTCTESNSRIGIRCLIAALPRRTGRRSEDWRELRKLVEQSGGCRVDLGRRLSMSAAASARAQGFFRAKGRRMQRFELPLPRWTVARMRVVATPQRSVNSLGTCSTYVAHDSDRGPCGIGSRCLRRCSSQGSG